MTEQTTKDVNLHAELCDRVASKLQDSMLRRGSGDMSSAEFVSLIRDVQLDMFQDLRLVVGIEDMPQSIQDEFASARHEETRNSLNYNKPHQNVAQKLIDQLQSER